MHFPGHLPTAVTIGLSTTRGDSHNRRRSPNKWQQSIDCHCRTLYSTCHVCSYYTRSSHPQAAAHHCHRAHIAEYYCNDLKTIALHARNAEYKPKVSILSSAVNVGRLSFAIT